MKFITFNQTGICIIDVDKCVKHWKDNWFIAQWKDEYTFVSMNRKNGVKYFKVKISIEQANELIKRKKLIYEPSGIFSSGSMWKNYRTVIRSNNFDLRKVTCPFCNETLQIKNLNKNKCSCGAFHYCGRSKKYIKEENV